MAAAELAMAQRHLASLYSISKLLASYDGADAQLDAIIGAVTRALELELCIVIEIDDAANRSRVVGAPELAGSRLDNAMARATQYLDYFFKGEAVPEAIIPDFATASIALPLARDRRIVGIIYAESAHPLDELDLSFLSTVASQLALAIDRQHAWHEAQEAVRSRDQVLAIVSHDVRNMLSTILMATQLAVEVVPPVERRRYGNNTFDLIRRTGARMNHLIRDLLDMASIDANRITVECEDCEIAPLIAELLELFRPQAAVRQIALAAELPGDLPALFVDRDRLLQVFTNLLSNAIKFTPRKGSVRILAEVQRDKIVFSVIDNGDGISAEQQPHIFDRFWQARHTAKLGTGLGLAIAKGIVEAMGGEIWVESRQGEGTRFSLSLPAVSQSRGANANAKAQGLAVEGRDESQHTPCG